MKTIIKATESSSTIETSSIGTADSNLIWIATPVSYIAIGQEDEPDNEESRDNSPFSEDEEF